MNELYRLMEDPENNHQNVEKIIELFDPKIKKSVLQTSPQEREDLAQELKIKLFETILNYDMNGVPGFIEFTDLIRKTG
ncbi:helix-turn-helix domain-containing protein [Rossellomorea sp. NPDC071047]|jgi:predicted component of type VI protein secretion system|uniref:helix-turn-helix domain-containing protein n=1 Tax=Rossellomorea sp. NPDC071047 TaxID=3390675 RepID=UPI003D035177